MRGTTTVAMVLTVIGTLAGATQAESQTMSALNVTTIGSAGVATGAAASLAALTAGTHEVALRPSYLQVTDAALLPPVVKLIAPDSGNVPVARLRPAFGNAMTSFYPFANEGFHVSGGSKLYGRMAAAPAELPDRMRFLLSSGPRLASARGTRQFAPAALMGFDRSVAHGLVLGVDGGMVMGRLSPAAYAVGRGPGAGRGLGGPAGEQRIGRSQGNALARMTMSYRF